MEFSFNWDHAAAAFPILLEAFLRVTLLVTVIGSFGAAVLGLVWAIATRQLPRPASRVLAWALDIIRMTPLPVQLLFAIAIFTDLGGFRALGNVGNDVLAISVGVFVFVVHYSTYMAESYRAGIESIRAGQWEAATALSLPQHRVWRAVILPQALRATIPSLGNWAIAMFKDTPFLLVIAVPEMVSEARRYGGANFTYVEAFTIAGLIFLAASYPTAILMRKLESKLAY